MPARDARGHPCGRDRPRVDGSLGRGAAHGGGDGVHLDRRLEQLEDVDRLEADLREKYGVGLDEVPGATESGVRAERKPKSREVARIIAEAALESANTCKAVTIAR